MATVTSDHRVTLYRNGRWAWEEVEQLSPSVLQHVRENFWKTDWPDKSDHSLIYSVHKNRSYILGTMALGWSPLYTGTNNNWAWLVMLQRSGHIVVWKAEAPVTKLSLSAFHDLNIAQPSVLTVYPGASGSFRPLNLKLFNEVRFNSSIFI